MTISTEFDHEGKRSDKTTVDRLAQIPASESLADTADRVLPLWKGDILPRLIRGENVLVIAHSNTIRRYILNEVNGIDYNYTGNNQYYYY